jgi:hypothetical protein
VTKQPQRRRINGRSEKVRLAALRAELERQEAKRRAEAEALRTPERRG